MSARRDSPLLAGEYPWRMIVHERLVVDNGIASNRAGRKSRFARFRC